MGVGLSGAEGGGVGSCLMGTEFQFCKIGRALEMGGGGGGYITVPLNQSLKMVTMVNCT